MRFQTWVVQSYFPVTAMETKALLGQLQHSLLAVATVGAQDCKLCLQKLCATMWQSLEGF